MECTKKLDRYDEYMNDNSDEYTKKLDSDDEYMNDSDDDHNEYYDMNEYTKKLDSDNDHNKYYTNDNYISEIVTVNVSEKECKYTPCGKCKNKKRWTRLLPDKTFLCFKCVRCHKCNSDPCYFEDGTWRENDWAYCRKCDDTIYLRS